MTSGASQGGQAAAPTSREVHGLVRGVSGDGASLQREKALIGLAVAHALQCPYCSTPLPGCLEAGSNMEQMTERFTGRGAARGAALIHALQAHISVNKSRCDAKALPVIRAARARRRALAAALRRELAAHGARLRRAARQTLQVNVGKLCNQRASTATLTPPQAHRIMTRRTAGPG